MLEAGTTIIPGYLRNRNEADLGDDLLTSSADREIEELFRQPARFAVGVVEGRARIRVGLALHGLDRRQRPSIGMTLTPARFGVSQTHITDTIRVLAYFGGDLFVTCHLLR